MIITKIEEIDGAGIFDVRVFDKKLRDTARPGQFLHIDCGMFLRRPISVCDVTDDGARFIFEVRGEGTRKLSELKSGDDIDIMGPLGNGFPIEGARPALIGGGIGIFPLLFLAKQFKNPKVFLGFRGKPFLIGEFPGEVYCASERDNKLVTDILPEVWDDCDVLYACGPTAMMKAVYELSGDRTMYVSTEERMGCGMGACLVCACKVKGRNLRVCKDGPVFLADDVFGENGAN